MNADLAELARLARAADELAVWPADSWNALARLGGLRWCIPQAYGGDGLQGPELFERYESLAGACLTTAFLLSQRDAACRRLLDSGNERLCRRLLPDLARGKHFITVGVAQLTTSRQHTAPPVTARQEEDDYVIDGAIPWITGAAHADHLVAGAVMENGKQILVVVPRDSPGIVIGKALELMALQGSLTAEVHCKHVWLHKQWLLAGPADQVLAGKRGGSGGLETSCLAIGLTGAAVRYLGEEARQRPQLAGDVARLEKAHRTLRQELYAVAANPGKPEAAQQIRAKANTLVLRATQATLAASKGTGFLRDHPAQRWARQALFFLVWSCPWPVTAATMAYLNAAGCDG